MDTKKVTIAVQIDNAINGYIVSKKVLTDNKAGYVWSTPEVYLDTSFKQVIVDLIKEHEFINRAEVTIVLTVPDDEIPF